ncbi:MAG TPA: YCF48-related protein, partial [Lacibacter sp.]|nr:YCF48-related protein [Lacibacter sp.]
ISCFTLITQGQVTYNTTNWRYSNPTPFGFTVLDLDFFDNARGIAVGQAGVAYTTNGGTNWTYGPLTYVNAAGQQLPAVMSDVHYVSTNTAYVVGSGGMMAKTTNGGVTWSFVTTPFFNSNRNINAVWFTDDNTGYIGGQWNTPDSIPKLYVTRNGGASWDSLAAPIGGKTRVGYINNPNLAPLIWDVTAKGKEIWRIEFTSSGVGYVTGGGQVHFPPIPAANASTCLPTGGTVGTSANNAALVWKFQNGVLTDYSLSKERLGYSGINTNTVTCGTQYNAAAIAPAIQQYRALSIINDNQIVLMSFNNNCVVRVNTGPADNTVNLATGQPEQGRYEILNFPFPPTQGPNAGPPIPNPQVLNASNPYQLRRASNGKLFSSGNFARMWTSVDNGNNWVEESSLPKGENFSTFATWALEITPTGRFISAGSNGVWADSVPGGQWRTPYKTVPLVVTHFEMEFPDCNNGMAVGGPSVTVTEDGGKTWQDKRRQDFANLNIAINGLAYPIPGMAYLVTNAGTIYNTTDKGTTLDPLYNNVALQFDDVDASGKDTVWAVAYSAFSVPAASRTTTIVRSYNGGASWQTFGGFPVGTTAPRFSRMSFGSRTVGYIAGSRNAVYKTTDGGATWTNISPFPALNNGPTGFPNAFVTYTEIQALDANTVVVIGNMFTNTGIRRVYRTTNGGTTWTDITGNLATDAPGNIVGLRMHDANNGYVTSGSQLFKTTDGGATWIKDVSPTGNIFETMSFAPSKVLPSVSMQNRILFVTGIAAPQANGTIMEYGDTTLLKMSVSETTTNASCTSPNSGTITVTVNGGIAPYRYSINGGPFQTSNVFTGQSQGPKTLTVQDAYCGLITKTVTVGFNNNLTVTATPADTSVCAGAPVQLRATGNATAYLWTPGAGLSAGNISNPVARVNAPTVYTVRATTSACTTTATVRISIRPNPVITAGP